MTMSGTTVKQLYNGDGSTTTFAIPFAYSASSEVVVIVRAASGAETVQTSPAHYSISGANVVMVSAPASGQKLLVKRSTAQTQETDYSASRTVSSSNLEDSLDKLTRIAQELKESSDRAVKAKASDTATVELPAATGNNLLGWNAGGTAIENKTFSEVASQGGALIASSNLSDLPIKATARDNLGLGSAATESASSFEPANANIQSHIGNTSNPHGTTASQVPFVATDYVGGSTVQAAIAEVGFDIDTHIADAEGAHPASAISVAPSGSISSTDVQAAIFEVNSDIEGHVADTTGAHAASAISVTPSGNVSSVNVQAALVELQADIDTLNTGAISGTPDRVPQFNATTGVIESSAVTTSELGRLSGVTSGIQGQIDAVSTAVSDHIADTTDAHDASAISITAISGVAASHVQGALAEHQGDITQLGSDLSAAQSTANTALSNAATAQSTANTAVTNAATAQSTANTHIALSSGVHGVTGSVVGTTDTQTLTNKTLTSPVMIGAATDNLSITGSGGSGYIDLAPQGTPPTASTSGAIVSSPGANQIRLKGTSAGDITLDFSLATASRTWQFPNASGPGSFVGTTSTQTLTNKTMSTGSTWSGNTIAISSGGTGQTTATSALNALLPSQTGNANKVLKTDGSNTSWGDAPSGGGSGGLNLFNLNSSYVVAGTDNSDAEATVGGWTAYADAAATSPVDMTGGAAPIDFITRTTSGPLNGTASFLIDIASGASQQGAGASLLTYVPPGYRGQTLTFEGVFSATGSLVEDDIRLFAYDVTNSTLITPFTSGKILGSAGKFKATFSVPSTTTQMRVGFHVARTSTGALSLKLDDLKLTDESVPTGMAGSDWLAYTPTLNSNTNVGTNAAYHRRVGDSLQVSGTIVWSGVGAASMLTVALPSGLSIDTARIPSASTNNSTFGHALAQKSAGLTRAEVAYTSTTAVKFLDVTGLNSNDFGSANSIQYTFTVPIAGWSSNVQMAESSTYRISSYLANGTRVTTTPTALGQYRSQLRQASTRFWNDTNGTPTALPSVANGIRIYNGAAWGVADTTSQPTRYEIFVGKNKQIKMEWYSGAGRTGFVDPTPGVRSTVDLGYTTNYDPTTGVLTVFRPVGQGSGSSGHQIWDSNGDTNATNPYFDVVVSENALAVGVQSPRSEAYFYGGNGHGTTNTKIRRYSNRSAQGTAFSDNFSTDMGTKGLEITILKDGFYTISKGDIRTGAAGQIGVTKNSSALTTNYLALSDALTMLGGKLIASSTEDMISVGVQLRAGEIIRPHGDGNLTGSGNATFFRIAEGSL
jgi:hypothetical protein